MRVLCIDNGLNTELAYRLGASNLFDSVAYFSPWQSDFVATRERAVGTGFKEFKRVYDLSRDTLDQYSGFVFPDLYWKDLALQLKSEGVGVWSAFDLEDLELDRIELLKAMELVGMATPSYAICKGVDNALAYARDGDFIKITGYSRGDVETAKHEASSPMWAVHLKQRLGPLANEIPIIVQKPIKEDVEGGYDQIIIKGRSLYPFLIGYEDKDAAYIAHVTSEMAPHLVPQAGRLMQLIEGTDYTNFLSTEFRGDVMIDITTRMPSPPGDIHLALWENLPSIIFAALADNTVEGLQYSYEYACELIVKSSKPEEFVFFDIPRELRSRVGVRRAFKKDGLLWSAPSREEELNEVGAIVGLGDTIEEAIKDGEETSKEIKMSHCCDVYPGNARELLKTAEKGTKEGIPF